MKILDDLRKMGEMSELSEIEAGWKIVRAGMMRRYLIFKRAVEWDWRLGMAFLSSQELFFAHFRNTECREMPPVSSLLLVPF